jgi:hypothetical protein
MPSGPSQDAGGGNGLSVLGAVGRGKCNAASGEALTLDRVGSAALTKTGWSQEVVPAGSALKTGVGTFLLGVP